MIMVEWDDVAPENDFGEGGGDFWRNISRERRGS